MRKVIFVLTIIAIVLLPVAGWVQHFVTSIQQEKWVLFVAGLIVPPVGVLHGWGIWLGLF